MSERNDIFVSYAHVDNKPFSGVESGWVDAFIENLKVFLDQQFGRTENYNLWMDYELRGNTPLTEDIITNLKNSATLLLILSPGYMGSKWCMKELETFEKVYGNKSSRIFVVEKTCLDKKPELFKELLGYKFWVRDGMQKIRTFATPSPKPKEEKYYEGLSDLATQLVQQIFKLREPLGDTSGAKSSENREPLATVFLAPVSDALMEKNAELSRYFEQQNIAVLPKNNSYLDEIESVLKGCSHFIQLLDENSNMGIPVKQYSNALQSKKTIVQWRSSTLDLASIKNTDYRAFLENETVIACNLSEFKKHVFNMLKPKKKTKHQSNPSEMIFVNGGQEDMELVKQVSNKLAQKGYFCSTPLIPEANSKPSEIREDLEQNLMECDISLMLYSKSSPIQVRNLLRYVWKMNSHRESPLKTALCLSTNGKPQLNVDVPEMMKLNCKGSIRDDCIEKFIKEMKG